MSYQLTISDPSENPAIIEVHRHFSVQGTILHDKPVPDDATITVQLLDQSGKMVRHAEQHQKRNMHLWTGCPMLVGYPKGMDDDWRKMKEYGFPPLLVKDEQDPEASIHDATIKCWYDDNSFKAIIVTATDVSHGLILDDKMHFTDEHGNPYTSLKEGSYTIRVTLTGRDGLVLASCEKPITIGHYRDVSIHRFNPTEHRRRMDAWCQEHHIHVLGDLVPGYLDPYLGTWYYHMGLLPMYLSGDVTQYGQGHVHMFVYLMEENSTSYSTELAFLETQGVVENPNRLSVYHYDIGEAELAGRQGSFMQFGKDEFLWVYRVDKVKGRREMEYQPSLVEASMTDKRHLSVKAGKSFAVAGVLRPWQFAEGEITLKEDNSYLWGNEIETILYQFDDGRRHWEETRKVGMIRPWGSSILEFYHLFSFPIEERGRGVTVTLVAKDKRGNTHTGATERLQILVL